MVYVVAFPLVSYCRGGRTEKREASTHSTAFGKEGFCRINVVTLIKKKRKKKTSTVWNFTHCLSVTCWGRWCLLERGPKGSTPGPVLERHHFDNCHFIAMGLGFLQQYDKQNVNKKGQRHAAQTNQNICCEDIIYFTAHKRRISIKDFLLKSRLYCIIWICTFLQPQSCSVHWANVFFKCNYSDRSFIQNMHASITLLWMRV